MSSYSFKQAVNFGLWFRRCFDPKGLLNSEELPERQIDKANNNLLMVREKKLDPSHSCGSTSVNSFIPLGH